MSSHKFDDFVNCPFDKSHWVMRGRAMVHIEKCRMRQTKPIKLTPSLDKHSFQDLPAVAGSEPPAGFHPLHGDEIWLENVPTYKPNPTERTTFLIRRTPHGLSPKERRTFRESERLRLIEWKIRNNIFDDDY
ncbi:hypothetical protein KR018_003813 [Drosophila ironensis]|nr:hypothetical protein KR018_003813 [Drosophila ironensis]